MARAFRINMNAAQEVSPGSNSPATGLGVAVLAGAGASARLEYTIAVRGLDWGPFTNRPAQTANAADDVIDAHFHQAPSGSNGPVRFGWRTHDVNDGDAVDDEFTVTNLGQAGAVPLGTVHGVWENSDPLATAGAFNSFAQDVVPLLQSAALGSQVPFYANIHTMTFPGGAIRGQLTCIATDAGETVNGLPGVRDDILPGLGGNDAINGFDGNDRIDGGTGRDIMNGGRGNDIYRVDQVVDVIIEGVGRGTDQVLTTVSYTLGSGREIEILAAANAAATAPISLTGNQFRNSLVGNAGRNILDGKGERDSMSGLGGNDIYIVDNVRDVVIESVGRGTDSVATSVSYALGAGQHIEQLSTTRSIGTSAINLTGNAINNAITGNAGANVIRGLGGNNSMFGSSGNDTMTGGTGRDFGQWRPRQRQADHPHARRRRWG